MKEKQMFYGYRIGVHSCIAPIPAYHGDATTFLRQEFIALVEELVDPSKGHTDLLRRMGTMAHIMHEHLGSELTVTLSWPFEGHVAVEAAQCTLPPDTKDKA